jgi:hypothetical protein
MGMGFSQIIVNEPRNRSYAVFPRETVSIPYSAPIHRQYKTEQLERQNQIKRCIHQIETSQYIKPNWDSYNAPAPTEESIHTTILFTRCCFLEEFIPDDIGAMAEGGMTVSFMENNKYAAVEFYNSGEVVALLSRPVDSDVWEISSNILAFQEVIRQIKQFLFLG